MNADVDDDDDDGAWMISQMLVCLSRVFCTSEQNNERIWVSITAARNNAHIYWQRFQNGHDVHIHQHPIITTQIHDSPRRQYMYLLRPARTTVETRTTEVSLLGGRRLSNVRLSGVQQRTEGISQSITALIESIAATTVQPRTPAIHLSINHSISQSIKHRNVNRPEYNRCLIRQFQLT